MAMLITEEEVNIPLDAMAFISMKAGKKLGGLINISGFHVDPGFRGRLKFSVYNAGSRDAVLEVGQPTFPIWFCNLDRATDTKYDGEHQGQQRLTAEDASRLRGEVASPQALSAEIKSLQRKVRGIGVLLATIGIAIAIALVKQFLEL
jgi:dCTP deaminase